MFAKGLFRCRARLWVVFVISLVMLFMALDSVSQSGTSIEEATANIHYVCAGASCGISATHTTIMNALAVSIPGDSILVAEGTYTESITVDESISLQGSWSRDFAVYSPTLYASTILGSGSQSVIRIEGGAAPLIQGFTITGGGGSFGAGISIDCSSGTIVENRIMQNTSDNIGGGIGIVVDATTNPIIISSNQIISNTVNAGLACGGGIYAGTGQGEANIAIQHNEIRGNVADDPSDSGGDGGGLYLGFDSGPTSTVVVEGNIIVANVADPWCCGGGIVIDGRGISLTNNIIANNVSTHGGGVCTYGGNPGASWLTNNTIVNNDGDGIHISNPFDLVIHLTNNIIASNVGYGIDTWSSTAQTISYNNVWGNGSKNYIHIPDPTGTDGNISSLPFLVDKSSGDWHLGACSQAIDAGTNIGAPSTDYEGDLRPFNGVTDMGADEYIGGGVCFRIYLPVIAKSR